MLVSENGTSAYYALKALKKEFIIKNDDVNRYFNDFHVIKFHLVSN